MADFLKALSRFRLRLMLRIAGYAALWGLLLALVMVIAAPWLRETFGAPDYPLTLALPLLLPAIYVAWSIVRRPDQRVIVQAADAWSGNSGSVVAAWDLAKADPDSPFVPPVMQRAAQQVRSARLPEPRVLRWALTAMIVMVGLVPLSRWAHAQMREDDAEQQQQDAARKVDVPPEQAEKLAKEAGAAAEKAKKLGAKTQEKLADDLEQAAREAQAGGKDKERALREAHNLADRAKAQRKAQEAREKAREALSGHSATHELAEAAKAADPRAMEAEAKRIAAEVRKPDGSIDAEKAQAVLKAAEDAARQAPGDAGLRRAAEELRKSLGEFAQQNGERAREELAKNLAEQGKTPAEIDEALKKIAELDKEALARQLSELAKQVSPLRDIEPNGRDLEQMWEKLKDMKISPEQAKQMAEQAGDLAKRLEIDAETLRKMLQEGRKFEGLEETAKKLVEEAMKNGMKISPGEAPDWAKDQMPKEWNGEQPGNPEGPQKSGSGEGQAGKEGGGPGTDGGGSVKNRGDPTKPVEGGKDPEGVDTKDTGKGEKDPEGKEERLDPNKAKDEKATRNTTGAEATGKGINTREEEERLPRRYRETARKYFDR